MSERGGTAPEKAGRTGIPSGRAPTGFLDDAGRGAADAAVEPAPVAEAPPAEPRAETMPARAAKGPSVALALGGGGARGLAHIHAIEALDELGIRPVAVAGSSIGAIMGAGLCAGVPGRAIREHVMRTFSNKAELAARLWRLRPSLMGGVARSGGLPRLGQVDIARVLDAFLMPLPRAFEALEIPLTAVAVDFYGGRELHLTGGDLPSALAASAAIPGVFRPVSRDGCVLVDGNIYNPCPFDLLHGKADIVIAVDVVGTPAGTPGTEPSTIDCLIGVNQLMMRDKIEDKLRRTPPDILLRPDMPVRALEFHRTAEILAQTAHVKDELKAALGRLGIAPAA